MAAPGAINIPPQLASLLDFGKPLDIALLDNVINEFFNGKTELQVLIVQFRNHPAAWTRVDAILEKSQNPQTKAIACDILIDTVKFKWKALPKEQREGIRTYTVGLIIKMSSNPETLKDKTLSVLLRKLNIVLVQIVKHEWPQNWPNFIPELVNSSKSSQSLCANNMQILLLLSEEVFDYGSGQMTQEKMMSMKKNLNKEFTLIFQLCDYILDNSTDPTLLTVTLRTLLRFLHWIPVGYIFETKLIQTLAMKFFPVALFQNDTLACLSEIAALKVKDHPEYNPKFVTLFGVVITAVQKLLTDETDVAKVYAGGANQVQTFVRHLAIFITSFLKSHLDLLEGGDEATWRVLYTSLTFLLRISVVNDAVVFKICLEYWCVLVADLYNTPRSVVAPGLTAASPMSGRVKMYQEILRRLRLVMISKMAKPEEVLIVEDENGEIVREQLKDTDAVTLYKNMRECLIFLTHLDPQDTQDVMLMKLAKQVDGSEWSWTNLNTLCWAIGSISGALNETMEKTFLVRVIKALLGLTEQKRGKDNKAVVASNIMYVVGQYPRFLRQHWKFLKTVANKLFEFMHEKHPGVQDMSVDTFLKIGRKCRRKFVTVQTNEKRPFIEEVLENLPKTIKDLEQGQIHVLYEALGEIIQAEQNADKRQQLVFKLMELPNQSWAQIVTAANHNPAVLWDIKTVKAVSLVLKTNNRVASSLGHGYLVQMGRIYLEMLQVYKLYSQYVSKKIESGGVQETKTVTVKHMRGVKKEALKLIQTFIHNCQPQDNESIMNNFLPALLDPVLDDYKQNVAEARDAEVLALFASFVEKLGLPMVPVVPRIFEAVFQCTLQMITKNFEDFPDHRIHFFRLLHAINAHAFPALLRFSGPQFKLIMDSIMWAMKHLERNVADTGLAILLDLIGNVQRSDAANDFYKAYYTDLVQELLAVLTDTFHKPGFAVQCDILSKLFTIVDSNQISVPLWAGKAEPSAFPNNQTFVRQFAVGLLSKAFPNLSQAQVHTVVKGMFDNAADQERFRDSLRDFLVQLKEFSGDDKEDLYRDQRQRQMDEEKKKQEAYIASVPGLKYSGPSAQQKKF